MRDKFFGISLNSTNRYTMQAGDGDLLEVTQWMDVVKTSESANLRGYHTCASHSFARSLNRSFDHSLGRSLDRSIYRLFCQLLDRSRTLARSLAHLDRSPILKPAT